MKSLCCNSSINCHIKYFSTLYFAKIFLLVLIIYLFFLPVMLPSVLPRLGTDLAARMFPGVWKPLFLRVPSRDRIPFPGRGSLPTSFVSFFILLYFFLPVFEANDLLCWVPDVLCQHSEVVLWNLLSVEMFFWWIFEGESGLPVLFLRHLRTALCCDLWSPPK